MERNVGSPEEQKNDIALEALKQAGENREKIDQVKENFEQFYREEVKFQADIKNKMDLVSKGQDHLKERFEQGTAKTLSELKSSFDEFRVEWGSKKKEDEVRDLKIKDVDKKSDKAHDKYEWLIRGFILVVLVAIVLGMMKGNMFTP